MTTTKFSIESFYRAQIASGLSSSTTCPFTLKVSKTPTLTTGLLTISPNTENEEIVQYSGIDAIAGTIIVIKRGIKYSGSALTTDGTDYNVVALMKDHTVNDLIRADINHLHLNQLTPAEDLLSGDNTFTGINNFSGKVIFDKEMNMPIYPDAASRDAVITSPREGSKVKLTTEGIVTTYIGGVWVPEASGTTANASLTVAGKVEIATQSEVDNSTDVGGTGANVALIPSTFNTSLINKALTDKATPTTSDRLVISDNNDSNKIKGVTFANLKAFIQNNLPVSTSTLGLAQMATDAIFGAGTSQTTYVNPYQLRYLKPVASDTIVAQANTPRGSSLLASPYTIIKEIKVNLKYAGTVRTVFTMYSNNSNIGTVYGKIYINGVATGVERTHVFTGTATSSTFTEDVTCNPGDLIQIYAKSLGSGSPDFLKDFHVNYDLGIVATDTVVNLN